MPLFTVTMRAGRSADEIDSLSSAIRAASVAAGYPANDLFQRFLSLEPGYFRVDPRYPALPKPRTGQMLIIEVLVSSGAETERKRALVKSLVEHLAAARVDPNDIMCSSWKPTVRTDRSAGASLLLPLHSCDQATSARPCIKPALYQIGSCPV